MGVVIYMLIQLESLIKTIGILDVFDILIVAFILYRVYKMLENTRAITLTRGLLILLLLAIITSWLELHVINWLLQKIVTLLFVALPIVFQPELRRALEHIGEGGFFKRSMLLNYEEACSLVSELDKAVTKLSSTKTGALIVLERNMGLNDICASGIKIDGIVSAEFLLNVFIPNTPLHDGAAIIRGNRLIAAGCLLPLTDDRSLSTELGTRHRAAIGLSEQCDAVVVIVSEETGTISVAEAGRIYRHLDSEQLKQYLMPIFSPRKTTLKEAVLKWRQKK